MKIFLILFLFITAHPLFSQNYPSHKEDDQLPIPLSINVSLKTASSISLSRGYDSRQADVQTGFAAGIEYYLIHDEGERNAGAGFEYQFKNKVYGIDGSFQNFPVYLFYELTLMKVKYIALPDLHLQLGYNFLHLNDGFPTEDASSKGGFYYAVGVSSKIIKHIYARLLYSSSQGEISLRDGSHLYTNNKISLTLLFR